MNNSSKRVFLVHIAGCLLFLALPVLSSPESSVPYMDLLRNPPTQRDMVAYVLLLFSFYANYFFIVPRLFFNRKYLAVVLLNLLGFILIMWIPDLLITGHGGGPPPQPFPGHSGLLPPGGPPPGIRINHHLFLFFMLIFFALVLHINNRWKQAEREKLNTQLAFLRAQINPHFLFNTLNSIYSLALRKSDQAPEAVVKLSGMMRYVLNDAGRNLVLLQEEINYVQDYIALQEIRYTEKMQVVFTIDGAVAGKRIAPLLLMPFIENAFKYGVNAEEPALITILVDLEGQQLRLLVKNKKVNRLRPEDSSGLGIENTRSRLQLLYPGAHVLTIYNTETDFTVHLSIQLI